MADTSKWDETLDELLAYLKGQQEAKARDLLNQQNAAASSGNTMVDVLQNASNQDMSRTSLANSILRQDPYAGLNYEIKSAAQKGLFEGQPVGFSFGTPTATPSGYSKYSPLQFNATDPMKHLVSDDVRSEYKLQSDTTAKQMSPTAKTIPFASIFPGLEQGQLDTLTGAVDKTAASTAADINANRASQQEWAKKSYEAATQKSSLWDKILSAVGAVGPVAKLLMGLLGKGEDTEAVKTASGATGISGPSSDLSSMYNFDGIPTDSFTYPTAGYAPLKPGVTTDWTWADPTTGSQSQGMDWNKFWKQYSPGMYTM